MVFGGIILIFVNSLRASQHKMEMKKRGNLLYEVIIHLILIALVFAMFFFATAGRVGTKDVKQQVLEKQIALMIDSAEPGMSFSISRVNKFGLVSKIELKDGKVHAYVADQKLSRGYDYFSKYDVLVEEKGGRFVISVS